MKFMQAAKHGGTQGAVNRIVIHATVSPCEPGGAQAVAHYFQTRGAGGSAHYVVDPREIVACVKENVVAYHAPPNTGSLGIELCDPQKGSASRWADDDHEAMLRLAADLVRRVANRWDVPLRRLTVAEVRAGKRGICGHVDVSRAFGQTDHTDPGDAFPWDHFMDLVHGDAPTTSWTETLMDNLPTLGKGDDNYDVKTIRWLLGARGYTPADPASLLLTKFDDQLVADVKRFQTAKKLDADGVVGPLTWRALYRQATA